MKTYRHLYTAILIAGIGLTALPGQAATPPSPTTISTRLSASFSAWIGSSTNTNSLITGLHSGTSYILIQAPTSPGGTPTQVTFPAPSKPMSYGDIKIALSIARKELATQGITQPTALELQNALYSTTPITINGKTVPSGVLAMRASGTGWGVIAQNLGFKLGEAMRATPAHSDKRTHSTPSTSHTSTHKAAHQHELHHSSNKSSTGTGNNSSSHSNSNSGGHGGGGSSSGGGGGGGHGGK